MRTRKLQADIVAEREKVQALMKQMQAVDEPTPAAA